MPLFTNIAETTFLWVCYPKRERKQLELISFEITDDFSGLVGRPARNLPSFRQA